MKSFEILSWMMKRMGECWMTMATLFRDSHCSTGNKSHNRDSGFYDTEKRHE